MYDIVLNVAVHFDLDMFCFKWKRNTNNNRYTVLLSVNKSTFIKTLQTYKTESMVG